MGSNISPLAAEIFMNNLENTIFLNSSILNKVSFWYRYVDDCLVLFNGTIDELNNFSNFINSIHPKIKFTLNIESNNSLSYLDLKISRFNNKFNFDIFRKSSHTDCVIPFNSCHPFSHKTAAFRSYFHRLFSIPLSPSNFAKEHKIINQIGLNNGYPIQLINSIFHKVRIKHLFKNLINFSTNNEMVFRSLPYFGHCFQFLQKLFKKHNITISFSTHNTLKLFLVNNKDQIPILHKSGVYQLTCSFCNSSYIGQTGRKFITRLNEHLYLINRYSNTNIYNTNSAFANHILCSEHSFSSDLNIKILHVCNKGSLLNSLETLEINRIFNNNSINCLNEMLNLNPSILLSSKL
ncbi:hypothetical protein RN001_008816 [Aquatica leii]|uniref:Reverse transcriptase domain-containing protein n=1 Tax=Aquatica leii TaxID=1421715 RepID=A0AAN7Q5F3_9COLE|nr:hypothetical protein RN001_008816 [Aquatica leii]